MGGDRFDAVIAGGGLSGLSLAAHLARLGWGDRSVLVVDDEQARPSARCWGYWSAGRGLLEAAVARRYEHVQVHAAGVSRRLPLGRYRYHVVRRPDLRTVVDSMVEGCPDFELRSGRVEHVGADADGATVSIDGESVRAGWVFDSVSAAAAVTPVDAWLAFTGWQLRADRPVFDPTAPVLFDFRTAQAGGARFVYVLPDGPRQALVELTEFVPRAGTPASPAQRRAAVATYLDEVVGLAAYEVLHTESAVLPLHVSPVVRGRTRVVPIGAAAGLIKASTGYGYPRIQRDSAAIARSLVRYGHPFATPPVRRWYRLLDALLLDVLADDPAQLELAFARLFAANPPDRVLRFLDEASRLDQDLRIMASLPPVPYLRALARRVGRESRPASVKSATRRGT
ncbi:MAG: lycopene cyclase family protein [Micromonosporaceae bacterium]